LLELRARRQRLPIPRDDTDDVVVAVRRHEGEALTAARDARQALDPLRDGRTFADAVEPAAGASPIERLANFTGRRS
jgi:hypothetical protein